MAYTPQLSAYHSGTLKRISWALGKPMTRVIDTIFDNVDRFLILAHEFAHELLHGVQERMGLSNKIKELEAEATAYVVCRHFGLSTESPTYLALYGVEELDIRASLQRIISTSSRIIS